MRVAPKKHSRFPAKMNFQSAGADNIYKKSALVRRVGDNRVGLDAFYPALSPNICSLQPKAFHTRKHSRFPAKMNRQSADADIFYKISAIVRHIGDNRTGLDAFYPTFSQTFAV